MPRDPGPQPDRWMPNQVVAHNMTQARELRQMTQAEVAERLSAFTGAKWTAVTVAQAEGSVGGSRQRHFAINEVVALGRTFDLPLLYFLVPPTDGPKGLDLADQSRPQAWPVLLVYLLGHRDNWSHLAERLADWATALYGTIRVPVADILVGDRDRSIVAGDPRDREPRTAEDALASALYGLAARGLPGGPVTPDEVRETSVALRKLANALDGFANYAPASILRHELPDHVTGKTTKEPDR